MKFNYDVEMIYILQSRTVTRDNSSALGKLHFYFCLINLSAFPQRVSHQPEVQEAPSPDRKPVQVSPAL